MVEMLKLGQAITKSTTSVNVYLFDFMIHCLGFMEPSFGKRFFLDAEVDGSCIRPCHLMEMFSIINSSNIFAQNLRAKSLHNQSLFFCCMACPSFWP